MNWKYERFDIAGAAVEQTNDPVDGMVVFSTFSEAKAAALSALYRLKVEVQMGINDLKDLRKSDCVNNY